MSRRFAAWLLSVPLMICGTEVAHWLVFRVVYPDPYVRAQVLSDSGHGYLRHWTSWVAILVALALVGFGARAFGRRTSSGGAVSLAPFLALAPLAFTLQEFGEHLAAGGSPLTAMLAPTFLPGLALQVPFAVLTYLVARTLLRAADRIRIRFASERRTLVASVSQLAAPLAVDVPRLLELCSGFGLRGPPLAATRA